MTKNLAAYFNDEELIAYGDFYKVKLDKKIELEEVKNKKLILVTSINPTTSGEGKTTTAIGLNDVFNYFNKKSIAALRQPSIGPFLGIKGGATGSGECCLVNDEKINCGLTGDFYKIATANNLISSIIDNYLYFENQLNIDETEIFWNRCLDLNDRSLRELNLNVTKTLQVKTSFSITAASYLMALFCLAKNEEDLRNKLNNTIIALNKEKKPIYLKELKITNALMMILNEAFLPNVTFSKYNNPVLMHGGPFANIAHGCNSLYSTFVALKKADYVFTEAGFGADLGAEKFFNIKCQSSGLVPNLVVLTITLKAVLEHDVTNKDNWIKSIESGFLLVKHHYNFLTKFGINVVIVINKFEGDEEKKLNYLFELCSKLTNTAISDIWKNGPKAGKNLLDLVLKNLSVNKKINFTYNYKDEVKKKIESVINNAYGISHIKYSKEVNEILNNNKHLIENYYVCIAKTPFSLTPNSLIKNIPDNEYSVTVEEIRINHATKFIIPVLSKIFLMPGLNSYPNAQKM